MKAAVWAVVAALLACAAAVAGATTSSQGFVVIGDAALAESLSEAPGLHVPTILLEVSGESEGAHAHSVAAELDAATEQALSAEVGLVSPFYMHENERIAANQDELAHVELLAHQLGAPVLTDVYADRAEKEVEQLEHSLLATEAAAEHEAAHDSEVELEDHVDMHREESLLETEAASEEGADELSMLEVSAPVVRASSSPRAKLAKANDYAYLDDPVAGGQPTVLKNLKGLDIYVVNRQVQDNDNEIRPVQPPHPMSAADRERARKAALMRKQLIHDVPQPKAAIKPKTRLNTLSAYEPSLADVRPLKKLKQMRGFKTGVPTVGAHGAAHLKAFIKTRGKSLMEVDAQLPGTGSLPGFPREEPKAAAAPVVVGQGSSFDSRYGKPVKLDDLLPLRAQLVEELDPLGAKPEKIGSTPNGW